MNKPVALLSTSLSEAELLWLGTAADAESFDPRVARIKLYDKLPRDFDPDSIDRRFYQDSKLTLLGLRRVAPHSPIFSDMEKTISSIRDKLFSNPGIAEIDVAQIAETSGLTVEKVQAVVIQLQSLGNFHSGFNTDFRGWPQTLFLAGPSAYDDYVRYETLDTLLERSFNRQAPSPYTASNITMGPALFTESFLLGATSTTTIKPGTAFVIMAMDPEKYELVDTLTAIKEACRAFNITAYRADEIEHQGVITSRILDEIRSCEYLIADLSYERPNVYYEIGFAHAINKKPILYRKFGTKLHFDLLVHNVPEYKHTTQLRELLLSRLENITGRGPSATS